MGNVCLPHEMNAQNDNIDINEVNASEPEEVEVVDPILYDHLAVEVLRAELRDDPEMFILNRLLMSYMFFEDYPKEIRVLHNETSPVAQQLNSTLIEGHKKQFLIPDTILENINKRVKFEHSSGPKTGIIEPLATQRLIIIHDNIEVIENFVYEVIDKPSYRATVENSKYIGFLRVNISETENSKNYKRQSEDSAYSVASIAHNKRKSVINHFKPNEEISEIARNDSGVSTAANSDPEYEYNTITAAQTPQTIDISEIDVNTNSFQLPASCIARFKEKNTELDEEDDENMENNLFVYKYYLNSSEFMKHFKNTVFPNYIGELLGFSRNSILVAKSIPGAIFCNRKDYSNPFWELGEFTDSMVEFEVIPAIFLPWPKTYAEIFEWTGKDRKPVNEEPEGKDYSWPTKKMIEKAKTFQSVIVPKGFMPKKQENPHMHLEWEVRFPKIERYLEFRMSHAQTRVFLYLIVLFKKFIEPLTQMHGLSLEHLRFLIFEECEANYRNWFEDRLGKKTIAVLEKLYKYLGKGEMPHYFINSRNMFENVPRRYLISNQEIIHDILESPVSYFFCALKDLRYSDNFYPLPDIEELENILQSDNLLSSATQMRQPAAPNKRENTNKDSKTKLDGEQLWNKKFYKRKQIHAQNQQKIEEEEEKKNLASDRPILSLDVNTNFKKKLSSTSTIRQMHVLTYFIKHFIEIAQTSLKISSINQTRFYLRQASYLNKLLEDIDSENARKFKTQIEFEEENCNKKEERNKQRLAMPKRNSAAFEYHSDILQFKGNTINLANLNKAYNFTKAKTKYVDFNDVENVKVDGDENNATVAESQENSDANSITSNLENRDVENIEVIADVHNETVKENQRNEDESYPKLIPYTNQDDEMNDIFNNFENIVEINNQTKDDDKIELNHLRSTAETADENNDRNDEPTQYFLNRIRNTVLGNQNEDTIDTTNDLEKFEVEDDEVDPERPSIPGIVTYPPIENQPNDDDRNFENHIENKSKLIKSNDENETTNHLKKTTFQNGDIDDINEKNFNNNQKNDDNLIIGSKTKPFFRIVTYEDRNKV